MDRRTLLRGALTAVVAPGTLGRSGSVDAASPRKGASQLQVHTVDRRLPAQRPDEMSGICTGFHDLDKRLGPIPDGALIVIASRPSMGKTILALNVAAHVAVRQGRPVTVFSAPFSARDVRDAMIASLARVPQCNVGDLLRQSQTGAVNRAADALAAAPVTIDSRLFLTIQELASGVSEAGAMWGMRNGLTVILSPGLLDPKWVVGGPPDGPAPIGMLLSDIAGQAGGAVLIETRLGYAAEERENNLPRVMLTDFEGHSRRLARAADVIMLLYRDCVYDTTFPDDLARIEVARNEFGKLGLVDVAFNYEEGGFADYVSPIRRSARVCKTFATIARWVT